ncbi:fimbrial protein [Enterobacter cloacae]|uniref:fimbrial protein n=1 Tax=Enterobacter cloacae TaxID=550 RepID=UPI0032DB948F
MQTPFLPTLSCLILLAISSAVQAQNRHWNSTVVGGDLHLQGVIEEGACIASVNSKDMSVDMGLYRANDFRQTGSTSDLHIQFTLSLTSCNPEMLKKVSVQFDGESDPNDPDLFLVSTGDRRPIGISGYDKLSGIGLVISDTEGFIYKPDTAHKINLHDSKEGLIVPFIAYYKSTERAVQPGELYSDVLFNVSYP